MSTNTGAPQVQGVVGFFDGPADLIVATRKVKEANFPHFDAFTPYPVHGLDHAQGLKRSPLPWVTFFAGITGFCAAFALQYWTSAVDWPLNVGGKPFNSWPAFVPILFELTVLFAALSTVGAMFALNGLPNISKKSADPALTRDRFALMIESAPKKCNWGTHGDEEPVPTFDDQAAANFLRQIGAKEVRVVAAEGWL